jgi:hypothetical protein
MYTVIASLSTPPSKIFGDLEGFIVQDGDYRNLMSHSANCYDAGVPFKLTYELQSYISRIENLFSIRITSIVDALK